MKTRLLFLFLMAISFAKAQFNVTENFNSLNVIPPTWTSQNFGLYTGGENCNGSYVPKATIYGSSNIAALISPSYVSDGNQILVGIRYKAILTSSFSGQVSISYALNNSDTWVQLFSDNFFDSTCRDLRGYISPNVVSVGSTIRFKFSAIRNAGQADILFDDFTAIQAAPTLLTEYLFNNSTQNIQGNSPFKAANNVVISYVNDRNNNPSSAVSINTIEGLQAPIAPSLLPRGNSRRAISLWFKVTGPLPSATSIFTYGSNANNKRFGAYLANISNVFFQAFANDKNFGGTYISNTWWHLVYSYDGRDLKAYLNGTLVGTEPYVLNTGFSDFQLAGTAIAPTVIDDLKIFDGALTDQQVLSLYNNNTLSSSNFSRNNQKVSLYPNPVNDILNIETETEIKSVVIYSLLGQKLKTAKSRSISVADLSTGTYIVRVEDANNVVETIKIVKQ